MEAYNYNLLINEISLLPNKNLDLDLINQESTVIKSDPKQELNPSAELVNLPLKNNEESNINKFKRSCWFDIDFTN